MRSSGPVRAVHYGGADYLAKANDEIVVMAMIETKEGLANLDKICATPGLDAVYIGRVDLSFALGLAPRGDNPEPVHVALDRSAMRAQARHQGGHALRERVRLAAGAVSVLSTYTASSPGVAQILSRLARPSLVSIIAITTISSFAFAR